MSPEQIQGGTIDARSDVFALGTVLYEILSYPQLSPGVTINEAIEIARLYCGDEAPTFINGVLDRVDGLVEIMFVAAK